ncbi:MAG: tellurite resistance/C4-dicarboxylate transporter family protein [Polyangiaceae bacterium]|nr:tellurite resistance/C4-dicarboxylate transporter family protein [Polyangiaceae bacterium]
MATLYPGYFALVMATGIISDACARFGHATLSGALLAFACVAHAGLCAATAARAWWFRAELSRDLHDPRVIFSFFTVVAASDVLGVQLAGHGYRAVAAALWVSSLAIWTALSYFSFALLIFTNERRGAGVVHGGWLIAIVGTESLVLLGLLLAPGLGRWETPVFVLVHTLWGVGVVLYGVFVTLFCHRIFFSRVLPSEAMPLFWVIMGAAAISANAGAGLLTCAPSSAALVELRPFLLGATLILWGWGTWWIPLLLLIGVWKHVVHRVPIVYHPMYWSLVFPLGMYSVASHRLSLAAGWPALAALAHGVAWVAVGAWSAAMVGLVRGLGRSVAAR